MVKNDTKNKCIDFLISSLQCLNQDQHVSLFGICMLLSNIAAPVFENSIATSGENIEFQSLEILYKLFAQKKTIL